jgi:hypothetical protein
MQPLWCYPAVMSKKPASDRADYFGMTDAAAVAGVHPNTVRRWLRASEQKAEAGLQRDFVATKPAGKRNGRWRIHIKSFLDFLQRMNARVVLAILNVLWLILDRLLH